MELGKVDVADTREQETSYDSSLPRRGCRVEDLCLERGQKPPLWLDTLLQDLSGANSLKALTLSLPNGLKVSPEITARLSERLADFLETSKLRTLACSATFFDLNIITRSLIKNRFLQCLNMCLVGYSDNDLSSLADVLENHNTTLRPSPPTSCPSCSESMDLSTPGRIGYYLWLNEMGRNVASNPETQPSKLARLIRKAVLKEFHPPSFSFTNLDVVYGLMRAQPGLWSRK